MDNINNTSAAFIGAAVTLVLAILFFIFLAIMIKLCLKYLYQKRMLEARRVEAQARRQQQRQVPPEVPVNPTFDWHHSIRIAGSPPPTYTEAKELPTVGPNEEISLQKVEPENEGEDEQEQNNFVAETNDRNVQSADESPRDVNGELLTAEQTTQSNGTTSLGPLPPIPTEGDGNESNTYYLWRDGNNSTH